MVNLRTLVRSAALVALGTSVLEAQRGRVLTSPRGQERIAAIAPPPPPPQPIPNLQLGETVFGSIPAIITADGRVLVNLGYGYEQVARSCPYAYGYGCQTYGYPMAPQTPIFGPYGPPTYAPPTYMPPAYGAPQYPTYPPNYYEPYQPRNNPQARTPRNGCPAGYVPTGGYPPCVDPSRSPSTAMPLPSRSTGPAPVRATTHQAAAASAPTASAVVVRRR